MNVDIALYAMNNNLSAQLDREIRVKVKSNPSKCNIKDSWWGTQTLGIDSYELNWLRFSSLSFENPRKNFYSIETDQN